MVPLHLLAFTLLYLLTARLLEDEIISATENAARGQLQHTSHEIHILALARPGNDIGGHLFEAFIASHQSINLRLFLPGGETIGPEVAPHEREHTDIVSFLESGANERMWLETDGNAKQMRGFSRLVGNQDCVPCHQMGSTLAITSMGFDVTDIVTQARSHSRRNLGWLLLAWGLLLGFTNAMVSRSARRAAEKLEADLAAAEAGDVSQLDSRSPFALDIVSDGLHKSLQDFLMRQKERQEHVASRLAHTDQLASLGQLAAGLAHEIKNPLAGIQGALEILKEDTTEEPTVELYNDMLAELKRVNGTLQTLLSSARPSPAQLAETDLRELLQEVTRLLEPGLRRQNVTLRSEISLGRRLRRR